MKRSGFKPKYPPRAERAERITPAYACLTVPVNMPRVSDAVVATPKENVVTSEAYRREVRKLCCIRCGIVGFTQFCHSDEGKGMGLKTDDRRGWPGCGPHAEGAYLAPGCHWLVGTSGTFTKEARRALEANYAARTRQTVRDAGNWPKGLADLDDAG